MSRQHTFVVVVTAPATMAESEARQLLEGALNLRHGTPAEYSELRAIESLDIEVRKDWAGPPGVQS